MPLADVVFNWFTVRDLRHVVCRGLLACLAFHESPLRFVEAANRPFPGKPIVGGSLTAGVSPLFILLEQSRIYDHPESNHSPPSIRHHLHHACAALDRVGKTSDYSTPVNDRHKRRTVRYPDGHRQHPVPATPAPAAPACPTRAQDGLGDLGPLASLDPSDCDVYTSIAREEPAVAMVTSMSSVPRPCACVRRASRILARVFDTALAAL